VATLGGYLLGPYDATAPSPRGFRRRSASPSLRWVCASLAREYTDLPRWRTSTEVSYARSTRLSNGVRVRRFAQPQVLGGAKLWSFDHKEAAGQRTRV
jgi:hypothetical protein